MIERKGRVSQCARRKIGVLPTRQEQNQSFDDRMKRVSFVDMCWRKSMSFFNTSEGKPDFHLSGGKTEFAEIDNFNSFSVGFRGAGEMKNGR